MKEVVEQVLKAKRAKQAAKTRTKKVGKVTGSKLTSRLRDGSKRAVVLELLRRNEGATIAEIAKATY